MIGTSNSTQELEMNLASKKVRSLTMYIPFSVLLGAVTIYVASRLAFVLDFGQLSPPETADFEMIQRALVSSFLVFLCLLGVARVIMYVNGLPRRRWRILAYWVLPIVLGLYIPDAWFPYMKLAIGTCVWLEILLFLDPLGKP